MEHPKGMAAGTRDPIDDVTRRLLAALREDARLPFAELARRVGLSGPAVADRLRRIEEEGLIKGYRAVLDPARLGYPLTAFVRLRSGLAEDGAVEALVRTMPEVLECHRVTGEESYLVKLVAASVAHLDTLLAALGLLGATSSTLVLNTPVEPRDPPLPPAGPPAAGGRP